MNFSAFEINILGQNCVPKKDGFRKLDHKFCCILASYLHTHTISYRG